MNVSSDMYEYLGKFAEDRDVLNMLSVNKKFNDPVFFERALGRKYPFLLNFKTDRVAWKQFYISMIYYISKMKESFPNLPDESFDPRDIRRGDKYWKTALKSAFKSTDLELITFFVNNTAINVTDFAGFLSPRFIKQPMLDFLKNANFDITLKELLRPLLDRGILSHGLLNKLLKTYIIQNHLEITEKYYRVDENMNKYLNEYLGSSEVGSLIPYKVLNKISSLSIMTQNEINQEQRNFIVTDEIKRLLFVIRQLLL